MLHMMSKVTSSSLRTLLRRRIISKETWSWRPNVVGRYSTQIRRQHAPGSLIQITTSWTMHALAQTVMVIGMICRSTPLDLMRTPMYAQRTKELVSSETIVLIHAEGMVFVSSIIWFQGNSRARVLHMIMITNQRVKLIHSGKIQPSLPIFMTSLVGRMEETVPLPRK